MTETPNSALWVGSCYQSAAPEPGRSPRGVGGNDTNDLAAMAAK